MAGTPVLDAEAARDLKLAFTRAGFAQAPIRQAMGTEIAHSYRMADLPIYERRLAAPTPLHTLLKLFALGIHVSLEDAADALQPLSLDTLQRGRILDVDGDVARSLIEMRELDGSLYANDIAREPAHLTADYVMGVSPSSMTLAALTVRRAATTALDLGTGCGVQAILAAPHTERVVATDANPRALAFASFNALLNGVTNVEFREGSFFEPVAGESFDLIVSNPPYVISPDTAYLYRDTGARGDAVSMQTVRGAAKHLSVGGFATVLVNWGHALDDDPNVAPRGWLAGLDCDAWILRSETQDPLTYIGEWNRNLSPSDYRAAVDRWSAHFQELGIEALTAGTVILRKSPGPHWIRVDESSSGGLRSCSDHIRRVFDNEDLLRTSEDDVLLDTRLALVGDHAVSQHLVCRDGAWTADSMVLRLEGGMHFEGRLDTGGLHLLRLLDGSRTYARAVADLAEQTETDRDALARATIPLVRLLLGLGFLEVSKSEVSKPEAGE